MGKLLLMGTMMVMTTNAFAQDSREQADGRVSIELSGGFVGDFDDSGLWESGYTVVTTGLWWASESVHLALGFGVTRWSYQPEDVVNSLVPSGATLIVEQSTGDLEILDLVPSVRWERAESMPMRLGFFLQGGAGVAYVETFALSEVLYDTGSGPFTAAAFEINETDFYLEGLAAAGLTRPVSRGSWLELFSSYRMIAADETANVFAVGIGFRVQI